MKHTLVLPTQEIQYIRAAVCLYRTGGHYPKNDIHFRIDNTGLVKKLNAELEPLIRKLTETNL